jgi:hypothetical protein
MRNLSLWALALIALTGCGGLGTSGLHASNAILPKSVATSAASSTAQATGTIQALFGGGFRIKTAGNGLLDISTNSSTTYTGAAPYVGESVTVVGTGSVDTSITATSVTQNGAGTSATPAPIATPALSTIGGPVDLVDPTSFEIDTTSHGHLWVHTTSSTTFVGGSPVVGDYENTVGTGSFESTYTAVAVSQTTAAPSTTTATGTIVAGTAYGFTLDVSSTYPSVPIMLDTSSVIAGGTLEAGATASVTGVGATSGAILAVNVVVSDPTPDVPATPTPAPISQTHILTAAYLGAPNGTTTVTAAQAAPYLTWAQTGSSNANTFAAAGIKTQIYEDPNRVVADSPLYYTGAQGAFAQSCSDVDVTEVTDGVTQYVMNPASTVLQAGYASLLNSIKASYTFNAVFQDDSGPLGELAGPFSPSLPCDYTDAAWISGGEALDQAATIPLILNGLSGLDGENPSELIQELGTSNVLGGNMENCYSSASEPENYGWLWAAEENTELQVNAMGKMFSCMEEERTDASASAAARIYAYASFLLTYNPSLDVLWEEFATSSGFEVFPEEQLVALDPAVSTPSSIAALEQTGGAYGIIYNECFLAGNFVGACAVAVNPEQGSSVPFPFPQFTHTLTLSGNGVLDGGTLSTQGAAPPEYLNGPAAVIAFP